MSHESISRAASTATYTGASLSVSSAVAGSAIPAGTQDIVLWWTTSQWTVAGIVVGMLTALLGLAVNVYYKRQHFKLAEARVNEAFPDGD